MPVSLAQLTKPMADRYFVDHPIDGTSATLDGPEAHHLAHVMRAKPGDRVILFDGSGAEFSAQIAAVARNRIALTVLARHEVDRELPVPLVLGAAIPKGDRQKWLVEKATEVGVSRIIPLITARSVVEPSPESLERLRRSVIEASKQCGRNRLLEIAAPLDWDAFLAQSTHFSQRWIAHPGDAALGQAGQIAPSAPAHAATGQLGAIGPEGGFTAEEVARAVACGWRTIDLGPRILRVETAVVVLATRMAAMGSRSA